MHGDSKHKESLLHNDFCVKIIETLNLRRKAGDGSTKNRFFRQSKNRSISRPAKSQVHRDGKKALKITRPKMYF
jgi:hypothetical protein